ncbi:hypothetical protein [Denitratisoma oestradiolicum]|uniref:Tetratricopeptide repeat protein n=1 Tax=Denitratisoma oestradiolicum TaxID=311182 RepID=A0A6S6Y188_9PROT|nr:hypothetical protein [Denitratisoma oestradiolicum]TWO80688.1 hypothetical protein CBW56_07930 [Denitratisoma oestradiolicum]CAB1371095.1 conserved exported protein of unknown function [Denitratisoma oestradiolicum]
MIFLGAGLLICLLGLASAAWADGAPAPSVRANAGHQRPAMVPESTWQRVSRGEWAAALPELMALEPQGAMDPAYNALLAEAALAVGENAQATLALERLVLLQPDNAGAWLDLAVASLQLGDRANAQRALDQVERGFAAPPGIRALIQDLRRRMQVQATLTEPSRHRLRGGLLLGHDSNANGGLAARSLSLTPGAGVIELPVADDFRPRAAPFWLLTGELATRQTLAGQAVEGRLALAEKRYDGLGEFDTRDIALAGAWQRPLLGGLGSVMAEWRRLDMGGQPLIQVPRLRLGLEWPLPDSGCRLLGAVDGEWRHYRGGLARYDGRLLWGEAGTRCPLARGALTLLARAARDDGSAERPGEDTRRQELALAWQGPAFRRGEAVLLAQAGRARDEAGYSPLIRNDARREIRRFSLRAELAWPLAEAWQLVAALEHTRQISNLGLFGLEQRLLTAGLRYQQ